LLAEKGKEHYYYIRERFNKEHAPLDFLFLNRCCFNGLIRFNRSGEFNVPFGHKPKRFSKAYIITKIVNQIDHTYVASRELNWTFTLQSYQETLANARAGDFIYCDPPYVGRHVDYFDSWTPEDERALYKELSKCHCKFILSTWHSNQYRRNDFLDSLWSEFHVLTREHFYHVGAKEVNRNPMLEALVMNYTPIEYREVSQPRQQQLALFEKIAEYQALHAEP